MICITVTYVVKPSYEAEALAIFHTMTQHTRTEPGNMLYIAHRSHSDPRHFFLYEQYADEIGSEGEKAFIHGNHGLMGFAVCLS